MKNNNTQSRYGIAPSTLLIAERRTELRKTLDGFKLLALLEFEPSDYTMKLARKITEHIRVAVITIDSPGSRMNTPAYRTHLDAINRFVLANQTGYTPPLDTYETSQTQTLTLCGKKLRDKVSRTWEVLFTAPFPQSILCIGPHVLITTWLCAVLAEQMSNARKNAKIPFKGAISGVRDYEPPCGLLTISTKRHIVLNRPRFELT